MKARWKKRWSKIQGGKPCIDQADIFCFNGSAVSFSAQELALPPDPEFLILGGIDESLDLQRQWRGRGGSAVLAASRHGHLHVRGQHPQAQPRQHLGHPAGWFHQQPDVVVPHQRVLERRWAPHREVRRELHHSGQGLPLDGAASALGRRDRGEQDATASAHHRAGRAAGRIASVGDTAVGRSRSESMGGCLRSSHCLALIFQHYTKYRK